MSAATRDRYTEVKDAVACAAALAAAALVFAGCLVCYDTDGYLVDGADTAGLRFAGVAEAGADNTDGDDGDLTISVSRSGSYLLNTSGLTAADVGRRVYLIDNQTVGVFEHASVDNDIYVGVITEYVSSTRCYVAIDPGDELEGVTLPDNASLAFGDANDLTMSWDGTRFVVHQATVNSEIRWGVDGAGIDQMWYGDTASTYMTWDQSADSLIFADNAKATWGTGSDISIAWDGTRLNVTQAAPNSEIRWGADDAGIDQMWYGDTASAYMQWDQSADTLLFGGTAKMGVCNRSIGASTAAAGSVSGDATALPAGTAPVYPTTGADDTKGVKVSATDKVTGRMIFVGNGVGNKILKVYPPLGGDINGLGADAAFSTVSGKGAILLCLDSAANTWLAW